jgi:hypothetical protein
MSIIKYDNNTSLLHHKAYTPGSVNWVMKSDNISYAAFLTYLENKGKPYDGWTYYGYVKHNIAYSVKQTCNHLKKANKDDFITAIRISFVIKRLMSVLSALENFKPGAYEPIPSKLERRVGKCESKAFAISKTKTDILTEWYEEPKKLAISEKPQPLKKFSRDAFLYKTVGKEFNAIIELHASIPTSALSTEDKYFLNETVSSYLPTIYAAVNTICDSSYSVVKEAQTELVSQLDMVRQELVRIQRISDNRVLDGLKSQSGFLKVRTKSISNFNA